MLDLTDKKILLNQLSKHHLWLKKRSGQNFLVDQKVLDTILDSANLDKNDTVLEIGPGLGTMTIELCKRAGQVIAVEIDPAIIKVLRENTKKSTNLQIVQADSLNLDTKQLEVKNEKFKIVANIPYSITSPLLTKYLYKESVKPKSLTLLLQKEVAEIIVAEPHNSQRGYLSIMVQALSSPRIIRNVLRESFFPVPRVDSAIVQIDLSGHCEVAVGDRSNLTRGTASSVAPLLPRSDIDGFFQFVKMGFSQKRKMLKNSLAAGLNLEKTIIEKLLQKANIKENSRAEDLTIEEWKKLWLFFERGSEATESRSKNEKQFSTRSARSNNMFGTLYVVATPIGNLEDITLRAIRTLKEVDFVICEDTRVSIKLLNHLQIKKELISFHQHSRITRIDFIVDKLRRGQNAALLTDSGTPGISDPGGVLTKKCLDEKIEVVPIPGASALAASISVSGLKSARFEFMGFLPKKKGRRKGLGYIKDGLSQDKERAFIVFESPYRVIKLLEELSKILPKNVKLVTCRELTKKFEEIKEGSAGELLEYYSQNKPRGEFVVVIKGNHYH